MDQHHLLHKIFLNNGNTELADMNFLNPAHPAFQAHLGSEYLYDSLKRDLNGRLVATFAKFSRRCR